MRSIVSNTTPLNYLVLIEAVEILPRLYRNVFIPLAVRNELMHANAPDEVRSWISKPPSWLQVGTPSHPPDSTLLTLDPGEREAIALASEFRDCLLLMDERDGVEIARDRGLRVIGTLAVLEAAASQELLDLEITFEKLRKTSFRSPLALMATMLDLDAERKKNKKL